MENVRKRNAVAVAVQVHPVVQVLHLNGAENVRKRNAVVLLLAAVLVVQVLHLNGAENVRKRNVAAVQVLLAALVAAVQVLHRMNVRKFMFARNVNLALHHLHLRAQVQVLHLVDVVLDIPTVANVKTNILEAVN